MSESLVYLRALELADAEQLYRWQSNPQLYATLGGTFRHPSHSGVEEWIRKKQSPSVSEFNFAICTAAGDRHIGNIYLRDIDWPSRRGELHIFIGDAADRSKGFGSAAVLALRGYAFEDLGLRRLYLSVLADNSAAIRAYERCGFRTEGTLRAHTLKAGKFVDVVVMGLNNEIE